MRFAWFPMLLVLAVACGDGATIVSPGRCRRASASKHALVPTVGAVRLGIACAMA